MTISLTKTFSGLIRIQRARRAAVSRLQPLIASTEAEIGAVYPFLWRLPYTIGFISMAITILAMRASRRIRSEELATVQVEAWQDVSGLCDADIGEQIVLLSAARDPDFMAGCAGASAVFRYDAGEIFAFEDRPHELSFGLLQSSVTPSSRTSEAIAELWKEFFDGNIQSLKGAIDV